MKLKASPSVIRKVACFGRMPASDALTTGLRILPKGVFACIGYRQKDEKRSQIGQNRARIRKELKSQKSGSKSQQKVNPDKVKVNPELEGPKVPSF
ncbi:hypothetical protein Tco_1439388 [Tanacetum coccineum]